MAEAATIRRLDWRFLLPSPPGGAPVRRLLLLGGPAGLERLAVSCGLAEAVTRTPGDGPVDLVAALDGTVVPEAAWRSLTADGVVYREVVRRSPGALLTYSPARLRLALERRGFVNAGRYAVLPGFGAPRAFLPLDVRHALAWWTESLFPAPRATRRVIETALRSGLGHHPGRLAAIVPHLAIVAVRSGAPPRPVSALAHPEAPLGVRALDLRPFVFADAGNRAVLLPFAPDSREPVAVVKVPKLSAVSGRTEHEHAVLHRVRAAVPPPIRTAIPAPLALLAWGSVSVAVESRVPGVSLLRSTGRWGERPERREADLRAAAAWLAEFHRDAPVECGAWDDAARRRWLDEPFAEYERRFGRDRHEARLGDALRARAAELHGRPFPTVWHHRDFNVWNVLRDGQRIGVIDWEGARPGPALVDLLHFATHWHETARHLYGARAQTAATRELWIGQPRARPAAAVRQAVHGYLERVGLDRRFLPLLLGYMWIELALRRSDQQADLGEHPADPRAANRNFPFIATLARHAPELLDTWR